MRRPALKENKRLFKKHFPGVKLVSWGADRVAGQVHPLVFVALSDTHAPECTVYFGKIDDQWDVQARCVHEDVAEFFPIAVELAKTKKKISKKYPKTSKYMPYEYNTREKLKMAESARRRRRLRATYRSGQRK